MNRQTDSQMDRRKDGSTFARMLNMGKNLKEVRLYASYAVNRLPCRAFKHLPACLLGSQSFTCNPAVWRCTSAPLHIAGKDEVQKEATPFEGNPGPTEQKSLCSCWGTWKRTTTDNVVMKVSKCVAEMFIAPYTSDAEHRCHIGIAMSCPMCASDATMWVAS